MERFFILDKYNTWYDWRLVLTAKNITPPEAKTNYVDLDGMSGSLDLSESLTGEITFTDRTITASFWTDEGTRKDREKRLREITSALHGRKIKIIEPDEPERYFYGRVKISNITNNSAYATFTLEATCEPWRYSLEDSSRTVEVNNSIASVVIRNNGVKTVCPIITVIGSIRIAYGEIATTLVDGSYKMPEVRLYQGVNVVEVSGTGSVTFVYKEADL